VTVQSLEWAGVLFGAIASTSGWIMIRGSAARVSGVLVTLLGGSVLMATVASAADAPAVSDAAFRIAVFVIGPMAILAYPRVRWAGAPALVAAAVILGGGIVAVMSTPNETWGIITVAAGSFGHLWWAFEHSDSVDRRALVWSTTAWSVALFVSTAVGFVGSAADASTVSDTVIELTGALLACVGPPAMAIGVVRPDLVDVRGILTEVVVGLSVAIVFLSVVLGVTSAADMATGRTLDLPAVVVVSTVAAFGVHPLARRLRGIVDQLLFGDRPEPLAAATKLADRISDDPALALVAVREALVLPYASLRVGGRSLATTGVAVPHTRTLPLRVADGSRGQLVVGLRPGDLTLRPDDEAVLRIVAPLLAQTLRARGLAEDLAESRRAAITAIAEERRRLRRDLHDGVGPSLTGIAFAADAARNRLDHDPALARDLLTRLRHDAADLIAEIRRLVEDLGPATLDDLGLAGAVQQYAAGLHAAGGRRIDVDVSTPAEVSQLPAAIEVAAYRIVVEALTNVARHSSATQVDVEITAHGQTLRVVVCDNGTKAGRWREGSGIASMRERAEQVRGRLQVGPSARGGLVEATLPW